MVGPSSRFQRVEDTECVALDEPAVQGVVARHHRTSGGFFSAQLSEWKLRDPLVALAHYDGLGGRSLGRHPRLPLAILTRGP